LEGLPSDLRAKMKANPVRRDRVNDWLGEHVNGKGKIIEVRVPVRIKPTRAKDGSYTVWISLESSNPPRVTFNALGICGRWNLCRSPEGDDTGPGSFSAVLV